MADHHCKIAWVYNKYNSRSKIYHKQRICYRGYSHFEAKALNNVYKLIKIINGMKIRLE